MSSPGTLPACTAAPAQLTATRLGELFEEEISRWSEVDPVLADALDSLRESTLGGGKRIRPAFCYWAHAAAGGNPDDRHPDDRHLADACAAIELLHAAALTHDDIIDSADTRRGRPTLNTRWSARHRELHLNGDSGRFGDGMAILLGDIALVYGERLLFECPPPVRATYDQMRLDVGYGQLLDVMGTANLWSATPEEAVRRATQISHYKTARYSVRGPISLGLALAGTSAQEAPAPGRVELELAEPLMEFGECIGEAFQLRDDLLDLFGDSSLTGKSVGSDIREGKPTLLIALTTARAGAGDLGTLRRRFARADVTDDDIEWVRNLARSTGALASVEERIEDLSGRADAILGSLDVPDDAASALSELAAFATGRDR